MADPAVTARKQMSDGELKAILDGKITNSISYFGGKLAQERVTALQYYNGEPFGNEQDGRSQVVSRDVAEAVDSMMPPLMKIFTSGDEAVRFDPRRPEDEEIAEQATDYVNWIWYVQNDGFRNTHDWFKDALLNRTAAVKIWWDEQEDVAKERYQGLTDGEFADLIQDTTSDEIEILSHTEYPDPMAAAVSLPPAPPEAAGGVPHAAAPPAQPAAGMPPGAPPPTAPPMQQPMQQPMLHDVVIRRTNRTGRVRILPIPGEEFLMDRRAVSLEETPFCAHRAKKTISDLVEMGYDYDLVKNLGAGDSADYNPERLERFRQEDETPYRTGAEYDPTMREVWVTEAYIKVDYDGDGIAELRKVTVAGDVGDSSPGVMVILDNEEADDHPFASLTPVPMPHKFFGMSIADQTKDLQLIKSVLWRASLDTTYNAIMPQLGVVEGQVNLDDLLTRRPGGIVRMKQPGAVEPLPSGQMGVDPFQMISYVDQVREQRTGVQRFSAGPGADALQNAYSNTATGANIVENSSQERLELIARGFAEMGMKPAFRRILKLVAKHQKKAEIIRLRGQFVPMDPREWDTEFDMSVTVGLGTGNRSQQLGLMTTLLGYTQQIIMAQQGLSGPVVTADDLYYQLNQLCKFGGLKSAQGYYTDPKANPMPPAQPKPDPALQKAQLEAQADLQKTQMQIQADHQKTAAQLMATQQTAQMNAAVERELGYAKIAVDNKAIDVDAALKARQHETDSYFRAHDAQRAAANDQRGAQTSDRDFQAAHPEYQPPVKAEPPAPPRKLTGVTLHHDADGLVAAAKRHYDDGTIEHVPVVRAPAP